ncbi:MAG: acetamidase [Nitrospinota bacterium]|nr:MAG: acetamidase [Nitrospinota bacterium]
MAEHYLSGERVHQCWDNSLSPLLTIDPGDTVVLETRDASNGHLTPYSTLSDYQNRPTGKGHPLTGPIAIRGAEPGDTLVVEILELKHKGWGWTGFRPGFGLLADEFPESYFTIWRLERDMGSFRPDIRLPLAPFCGVMGVAPHEPGTFPTIAPAAHGGNMDIRHLTQGSTLFLPVFVPGALFSVGDGHAAQGDGEVCGTGIEAPLVVTLRFHLRPQEHLPEPQFFTPTLLSPRAQAQGFYVTTGYHSDLMECTRKAIRYMIEHLVRHHNLSREEAYILCSTAVDLKISEVVDAPHWIVSAYLPQSIFV